MNTRRLVLFSVLLMSSGFAISQMSQAPMTNSDLVNMAKSGIGDQTIILAIQQGPTQFDTSPQALIVLKKAGLSDQVLNAVLAATSRSTRPLQNKQSGVHQTPNTRVHPNEASMAAHALFQKALDAIGPKEKTLSIQATRSKGIYTVPTSSGEVKSYDTEVTRVYPDKIATIYTLSSSPNLKQIVTHDFGYTSSGDTKAPLSQSQIESYQQSLTFQPISVAQHPDNYSVELTGTEDQGGTTVDLLRISISGKSVIWGIDPQSGRLLSSRAPSGDQVTLYSDYRLVDGIHIAFHAVTTSGGQRTEVSFKEFEINPTVDMTLFNQPTQGGAQAGNAQAQSNTTPKLEQPATVQIKDSADLNAYQRAAKESDPTAKARSLERFLTTYPQSTLKSAALDSLVDTYQQLAEAYTKPEALDMIQAVWLYARAWNLAPANSKAQAETKLEYYFRKYHGSLDGLDNIKAAAKNSFAPESFYFSTVSTSSVASSPQSAGGGQSFTLRVLQSESVPYVQESGGGISTSCNIVGSSQTSAFANAYGNSAYGNATTTSSQHMSCRSYDTTIRWPHVLIMMFAQGSDGNSYMFGCDRAWRWSKCQPLQAGDTFNAQFTNKGLEVEAESANGKRMQLTYHVQQSRASR